MENNGKIELDLIREKENFIGFYDIKLLKSEYWV